MHPCYWVYDNGPTSRARFHKGQCRFCNHGQGIHVDAGPHNGGWCGPFDTRAEAESCARATGRRDVGPCGHCLG